MKLDWLLFCFLLLFWFVDIIWLILFFQVYLWFLFLSLTLSFVRFISCLAETNWTAFDFAGGESELVSGFNVEYGGGGLALNFFGFMRLSFCIIFLVSDLSYFFMLRLLLCLSCLFGLVGPYPGYVTIS